MVRALKGERKMRSNIPLKIFITSFCLGLILLLTGDTCLADMAKKITEYKHYHKKYTDSVSGEISQIRPTYIGVITHVDKSAGEDTEMIFLIDDEVVFKRKKLAELLEGDQVKITFENVTEPDPEDATKEIFVQKVTKEIQFLREKSKSLQSVDK